MGLAVSDDRARSARCARPVGVAHGLTAVATKTAFEAHRAAAGMRCDLDHGYSISRGSLRDGAWYAPLVPFRSSPGRCANSGLSIGF